MGKKNLSGLCASEILLVPLEGMRQVNRNAPQYLFLRLARKTQLNETELNGFWNQGMMRTLWSETTLLFSFKT